MTVQALAKRTTSADLSLVDWIQMWADARTDANSPRRADLKRDKTRAVSEFFTRTDKGPGDVTPIDVKTWQAELEGRGLEHSTVYGMISRISSFFEWAMSEPILAERIRSNPVNLARPKAPKPYQSESCKALDDEEVIALLEVVRGKASFADVVGKRDYALLLWFVATGWRRREILSLKWGDVKINGGLHVHTRTKGGDYRSKEVADPQVAEALVDYLKASGRWGNLKPEDPLWTRHDQAGEPGAALSSHSFAANLKRYARKVGIEGFHLHQFRHTYARMVSEDTGSIGATQEALGHRNRAATRVYVQTVGLKRDNHSGAILDRLRVH
ncbi:tyrosine-type recombinase/integrase [Chloroflexota bacterium]